MAALPRRLHGTPEVLLDSVVRPPAARAPRSDRPDPRGRHHPGGDVMKTRQQAADGFYRHLREWFTAFLPRQRGAAENTITSCRQTWNMLLGYVAEHHHIGVEKVTFTMYDLAARDAEMLAMNLADIDTRRLTVDLLGKGSKPRRLPITSQTARHFGRYAAVFFFFNDTATTEIYTMRNHRPTRMSDDN